MIGFKVASLTVAVLVLAWQAMVVNVTLVDVELTSKLPADLRAMGWVGRSPHRLLTWLARGALSLAALGCASELLRLVN